MRHRKKGRKLKRKKDQRRALIKSLARELILKEEMITTLAKAKEVQRFIEKKITKAKNDSLATLRYLRKFFSENVAFKLIKNIAPRYKERKGGYTRIIKLPLKNDQGAQMAKIELIK